jgi:hypothetical protein
MIDLKSMALEMPEVAGHPNRLGFRGVLTTVDVPSHRAPSGAKGHLVVLTKHAAEAALPSLLGMALDYAPTLDRHDVRRKVGVITGAEIVGKNLELEGYLYARDFPEIVGEIEKSGRKLDSISVECAAEGECAGIRNIRAGRWAEGYRLGSSLRSAATEILSLTEKMVPRWKREWYRPTIRAEATVPMRGAGGLGLSYEVTDVLLRDAGEQIWRLEKVTFTGAAILRRDKAAYRNTWIELSR